MSAARSGKFVLIAGALSLLGGCQTVGPIAIDRGRGQYNNILQSTAKEQTLANIVRVSNHEPMSYMDVTEVDALTSFSGQVNGGLTSIGAKPGTSGGTLAGQVGNVAGGVQYSEAPTIRYQPLLGQPLVAQLITPISPDALALLFDSAWDITPLLDFATAYMTLDPSEYYAVLNIISELNDYRALTLAATKSELTKQQDSTRTVPVDSSGKVILEVTNKSTGTPANDALTIYLQPFRPHELHPDLSTSRQELQLWIRLLWLYSGTQPKAPAKSAICAKYQGELRTLALSQHPSFDPNAVGKCLPNFIELRNTPVMPDKLRETGLISGAPLLRTYSALGILKNAVEEHPKIEFVSPDKYSEIVNHPWNVQNANTASFYTLLPGDEDPRDNPAPEGQEAATIYDRMNHEVEDSIKGSSPDNLFVYEPKPKPNISVDVDFLQANYRLGSLRRYILIIADNHPPPANAYVSHADQGKWYYIDGNDEISQKNFELVTLFMTMMAIPSAVPPLSPVINVGAGG